MSFHCFDRLARVLTRFGTRRSLLGAGLGVSGGLLAGVAAKGGADQEATPAPEGENPAFLFVQTALSGTFTPNPSAGTPTGGGTPVAGAGASYLLSLEGHHGETIYFSDRPERIFGEAPTEQFLEGLGFSPFNPPNAALVAETAQGEQVVVLELINPTYDQDTQALTYGAEILAEYEVEGLAPVAKQVSGELPPEFGHASLFIDDCPDATFPCCIDAELGRCEGNLTSGMCWSWERFSCNPCRNPDEECNNTYPACGGNCVWSVTTDVG